MQTSQVQKSEKIISRDWVENFIFMSKKKDRTHKKMLIRRVKKMISRFVDKLNKARKNNKQRNNFHRLYQITELHMKINTVSPWMLLVSTIAKNVW